MVTILTEDEQFFIRPSDVSAEGHLWDSFDHLETEISARYIVRLCQQRGNWKPFTLAELEAVYQAAGCFDGFHFNRLIHPQPTLYENTKKRGGGWIVEGDGKYFITDEFVVRVNRAKVRR